MSFYGAGTGRMKEGGDWRGMEIFFMCALVEFVYR